METERMSMRWSDKLAIGMGIAIGASAVIYIGNSIWNQDAINKLAEQDREQIKLILSSHAEKMKELEDTINKTDAEVVISGTPIDITRVLKSSKPIVRIRYSVGKETSKELEGLIDKFIKKHLS